MNDVAPQTMGLMFALYEGLDRKGPGSAASTRQALAQLGDIPPQPEFVEFGCGAGAATIVLADVTKGNVTAVDICQTYLYELSARAAKAGVAGRISTLRADMAYPPFPDGSFDVVWSEGAIYIAGFQRGLKHWRRLLRPGGYIAVTELTWLVADRPSAAAAFFAAEYPAMTSIEHNLALVRATGFEPLAHFVLPAEAWLNYYRPLEERIVAFLAQHAAERDAAALVEEVRQEIQIWHQAGESYGYVFYLARTR